MNLEKVSHFMNEITGVVNSNMQASTQAFALANTAARVAQDGEQVMGNVVDRIDASSRRISDIIATIDGIAFQTNMLALNTAVEAARSGEHGRGFAVVASEVRSLAGRSAEAAKEIKTLVQGSVEEVQAGSTLVAQAGTTMKGISDSVNQLTAIIKQLTEAGSTQSAGILQINDAVSAISQLTHQNSALVEESAAAAGSLNEEAARLSSTVSVFKLAPPKPRALASPA